MGKLAKIKAAEQRKLKKEEENDVEMGSEESSSSGSEGEDNAVEAPAGAQDKKGSKWTNRERVLIFAARGADARARHLMNDLRALMPHAKGETKLEKSTPLNTINEIAYLKNCTKVIFFESRKHQDLYLWMTNVGEGPSIKFLVHNVHTMKELKMSGNCLKGSRPILSFDSGFDAKPQFAVIKESLTQIFATPNHHPRSQPFIDHVFNFSLTPDGRIWFRNFQIVDETQQLQEIGPRFVLEVHKIFAGSFEGDILFDNPEYTTPSSMRRMLKLKKEDAFMSRKEAQEELEKKKIKMEEIFDEHVDDPVGDIYDTDLVVEGGDASKIIRAIEGKKKRMKQVNGKKKNTAKTDAMEE